MKGTKVDGIYDADPMIQPNATRFDRISYRQVLEQGLKVMDATAISLCMDLPPEAWGIPSIPITGFSAFGDSTEGPYTNTNHAFEFIDNLSWIKGRHSWKFGGNVRYDMYNQIGNQFARGNFQFQNIATGYAFADFMNPPTCVNDHPRTLARKIGTLTTNHTSRAANSAKRARDNLLIPDEFDKMPLNFAFFLA